MRRLQLQISVLLLMFLANHAWAQGNYPLYTRCVDKDSSFVSREIGLPTSFNSRIACIDYVNKLPALLQSKGYVTASIDSVKFDSSAANLVLFIGDSYHWARLDASTVEPSLLDAVGWNAKEFAGRPLDFNEVANWQNRILDYLENNGYPFAKVFLDSLMLGNDQVAAQLKVDKGPSYKVDSIRVYGEVKISNNYLQRYLEIPNGSRYNKEKLLQVSRKLNALAYLEEEQPSTLTRLGTGSVLNLYLRKKRSSQVNVLVGFLPNNDQLSSKKLLVTGEANILLRNELGSGETIGLNWQQIQVKSPRLNLLFQYPYLFRSPIGLDFSFDIFQKDTTFLNINLQLGAQYVLNINQSGKIFIQRFQTVYNGVNKNFVLFNRRLPDEADVSSVNLGVDYEYNNTNYRFNPRKGNEFRIITTAGTKKIKKNSQILELKDPGDPSYDFAVLYDTVKLKTYQFRVRTSAAHYFPVGKQSTVKAAINAGIFQSGNIFKNELFQIGGYKLLRGFDEESQYLSQFAIVTLEYRWLVGRNSFFYVLTDGGWGRNNSQNNSVNYSYFGTGLGLAFETKAGIFNLAWAVGRRNDVPFNLRQSKIHFGFANYF